MNHVHDEILILEIEVRCGLIKQQNGWVLKKGSGEQDDLPLASAQSIEGAILEMAYSKFIQHRRGFTTVSARRPPQGAESARPRHAITPRFWRWPYWDKESFYFNSNTALGEKSYVKSRLFYDLFKNSLNSFDDDTYSTMTRRSSFKSWYDDHTAGGSIELGTALIPRNTLKTAFHYKRDIHKEQNAEGAAVQRFEDEIFSLGLEDTIDITQQFYAIVGASYDHVKTIEAEDRNSTTNQISDFPTGDASAFNPQAGLFYKVFEDGLAHVSVAGKSRLPSIKDKFSYRLGTALPNPDLDAEKSINYEVGYQHLIFKRLLAEVTFFYYDINDFVLFKTVPDPADPTRALNQNQNIGEVEQYGIELGLSGQILSRLRGGVNYTYFQSHNLSTDDEILNTPVHKVFAYLQFFPIERFSVLGDIEYDSKRFSSTDGLRVADGFFTANSKAILEPYDGLFFELGVKNIFDENYELDEGFPQPGRSFFANVRYRF